eukprot:1362751-Rhodomonas_salina.3
MEQSRGRVWGDQSEGTEGERGESRGKAWEELRCRAEREPIDRRRTGLALRHQGRLELAPARAKLGTACRGRGWWRSSRRRWLKRRTSLFGKQTCQ